MKYMLLIYEDERGYGRDRDAPRPEIMARHMEYQAGLGGAMQGGAGLKSAAAATTLRAASGKQTIHDGPFAETKEQLGGFYLIDVPDLDAAISAARKLPLATGEGAVEIRPLLQGG